MARCSGSNHIPANATIPTPIVKDNQVYIASGYGVGSLSFTIEPDNKIKMLYDETASPARS